MLIVAFSDPKICRNGEIVDNISSSEDPWTPQKSVPGTPVSPKKVTDILKNS